MQSQLRRNDQAMALGCKWTPDGVSFGVFSDHAEGIDVCLFDSDNQETDRIPLTGIDQNIWGGLIPGLEAGQRYGLRAHGPWAPEHGHRFNPRKLLIDPYATLIDGHVVHHPSLSGDSDQDSAPYMPKAVVPDPARTFDWQDDVSPYRRWGETVIYEAHVKGLTALHPDLPDAERGSFLGLAHPSIINHLTSLGVTAIELLPVHGFVDDAFLIRRGLRNYWGYNSVNFFHPDSRYCAGMGPDALKTAVRTLHRAGIEVILDVVYNHTAESDATGPTLSFRGLDNASYYRLPENDRSTYINDTGCGNTVNVAHPMVQRLVLDSLRYWVDEFHIDGFRFDLGPILGRTDDGFDPDADFFGALLNDPALANVKLIMEPWDIGPGGYQLGNFPVRCAEWNDRFRDDVRRFWRGDEGTAAAFADRMMGSAEIFDRIGRAPHASVNFVTAHDGFTLMDLVSYERKHNKPNGEKNRDGHGENISSNGGAEGPTDDVAINNIRNRRRRNLYATAVLASGTPMLLAGDEIGNSQRGNNNAYCQDNPTTWLAWDDVDPDFLAFTRRVINLRAQTPALTDDTFLHGELVHDDGALNIEWLGFDDFPIAWDDPSFRVISYVVRAKNHAGALIETAVVFNGMTESASLTLPETCTASQWHHVLNTANDDGHADGEFPPHHSFLVADQSINVFIAGKAP